MIEKRAQVDTHIIAAGREESKRKVEKLTVTQRLDQTQNMLYTTSVRANITILGGTYIWD